LKKAEYERDENGVGIVRVPGASGFFAQGDTFEEARANLQDVLEKYRKFHFSDADKRRLSRF